MAMPGYLHTGTERIGNLHFSIMTAVGKYTLVYAYACMRVYG